MSRRTVRRHSTLVRAARIESLERRMLLSLAPAGLEFRVNTFTTGIQLDAAVASDADGDFVVVWQGAGSGDTQGIFAQRYNAAGVAQGGEFRVNTPTTPTQSRPTAAMDADGDFVVAWQSDFQEASSYGVYAQRFNAAGVPQGGEFHVNTFTTGQQNRPSVAMDASGNFVITWQSTQETGPTTGIYAQRYNASGVAQGGEFHVNTFTTNLQRDPDVAMDADGDFVIAWHSRDQAGSGYGVYAQRFDSTGTAQGGEFQVDPSFAEVLNISPVSLGMDASGDFVVIFATFNRDEVHGQRFNAAGVAQGSAFHVNTFTTGFQADPAVAMDAGGNFLIAWSSAAQDGSGDGVFAQAYNAAGVAQGGEFRANTFTTGGQQSPAVTMDSDGDAVVAWDGPSSTDTFGISAQRYDESNPDTAPPMVGGVFLDTALVFPYSTNRQALSHVVVSFSENMSDAGGPIGLNSVTNPANWLITRNGANVTPTISYGFNPAANRFEAVVNLPQSFGMGNFLLKVRDNVRDIADNRLDGNLDGTAGGSLLLPFSVGISPRGGEFQVNTFGNSNQIFSDVAMNATGDFVVVWQSCLQDGSGDGIYRQLYDASGFPLGTEARVNTFTTLDQQNPSVAMDATGNFVVAWESIGQDGSAGGVYAQRYSAAGVAQGGEIKVNTFTTNGQLSPSVAMDASGDFVVVWDSFSQEPGSTGVYGQRYNAAGVPQGSEFHVNTFTADIQVIPDVSMDANGNFVVTWTSNLQDGSGFGIYAQRFNSAGVPQGGEFRVNAFTTNSQQSPSVAMDASGSFVIAWGSFGQDGSSSGIYAHRYNAAGVPQGSEFRVNTFTTNHQILASVAVDTDGDFIVAWASDGQDGSEYGVYAQRYNAAGVVQGDEFRVNSHTTEIQNAPTAVMDADGDFVITWDSRYQDTDGYGVYAQRYGLRNLPTVATLADTPDPVSGGNSITLSASGVSADQGAISSVAFYRETNVEPGLQVGFEGDTLVGTDTTPSAGFWSVTVNSFGLPSATYTYWAQALDDVGLIGPPASTTNTVIEPVPEVTGSNFLFDTLPQRVTFTFNVSVGPTLSLADFIVQKLPAGPIVTPDSLSYNSLTNTATLSFSAPLPDGNYRATVLAAGITNLSGDPLPADVIFDFFFLLGDANHDGRVNLGDFNILAANFGQTPRNFTQGDFNYDTIVNLSDFNILAARFGVVLSPSAGDRFGQTLIGAIPDDSDALDDALMALLT